LTLRHSRSTNTLSRQAPFAVHADRDAVLGEHAGELTALVGVEDVRLPETGGSMAKKARRL
jgi:hypothetical protein